MIALALLLLAAEPALPEVMKAEPLAEWDARFDRADGWVGGDGAYSVVVSEKRAIWLFGDTWFGSVRGGKRTGVAMVNNSVAIQEGRGGDAKLSFVIPGPADDVSRTIFRPGEGAGWFWPLAGAYHDGKLAVFLARVEKNGAGAFGFKHVSQWLGEVHNPGDAPTAWRTTYTRLPFAEFAPGRTRSFGSATLRVKDDVYVYGYDEKPGKPFAVRKLVVARVPAGKLADYDSWRFFSGGEWKPDAKELTALADNVATELSVSYLPAFKQFVLVYTENGLSERIVGRFADAPEGPWSKPVVLYTCPEMKRDKRLFTYAAKAHPHLAGDGELVVSYVVNSFELAPVINDATLYRPRFVRVTLK